MSTGPGLRQLTVMPRSASASPAQIALAWLLALYERLLLIPGTSSVAHLEVNVAAGDLLLDDDDLATLDGATQIGGPGF